MAASIDWQLTRCHRPLPSSLLPEGFPVLSDASSDLLCEPAVVFLYETFVRAKINYADKEYSVTNLANDLKGWFTYLEHVELDWAEATESHVAGYVHAMAITIAPKTAKFHAEQTMKRRVSTVSNLYRWAARVHFCKWDDSNDELLLQKASTNRGARYFEWPDCSSNQDAYRIKGLLKDEAKEIFKKLGERPTEHEQAWKDFGQGVSKSLPPSAKDRLAAEMALNAGLRVFECARLKLESVQKYLDDFENIVATKLYPVDIKGKGGKTLPTNFSGALILQIAAYVRGERACCNPRTDTVLVNPPHYGPSLMGRQCTTRTIERRFSEACIALGVLREEDYFAIGDDGRYESTPRKRKRPKYVFHDLRHTFAFWTYLARRWTDAEPWKYVSEQLRHASVETTLKIYLAHINAYEAIVSDDFLESFKTRRSARN